MNTREVNQLRLSNNLVEGKFGRKRIPERNVHHSTSAELVKRKQFPSLVERRQERQVFKDQSSLIQHLRKELEQKNNEINWLKQSIQTRHVIKPVDTLPALKTRSPRKQNNSAISLTEEEKKTKTVSPPSHRNLVERKLFTKKSPKSLTDNPITGMPQYLNLNYSLTPGNLKNQSIRPYFH